MEFPRRPDSPVFCNFENMKFMAIRDLRFLLFMLALLSACKATTDPIVTAGSGSISGNVKAYGTTAAEPVNPFGIQITLQATQFQATSDTLGNFHIDNIPAGVYNIIFWKPGFDSMIYPVHHLIGAGTDVINDAYLIQESNDSIVFKNIIPVFTVSITKFVHIIDTLIKIDPGGGRDTIVRSYDTTIIIYDTVRTPTTLVVNGSLIGNTPPNDLYVYSSLDSGLFPEMMCNEAENLTIDEWLRMHQSDTSFHSAFQVPHIVNGSFADTLSSDIKGRKPFSFASGQVIYVYAFGHSNLIGLPSLRGQYEHFFTKPYGPQCVRFKYVVP
jgi:hypothetical protein